MSKNERGWCVSMAARFGTYSLAVCNSSTSPRISKYNSPSTVLWAPITLDGTAAFWQASRKLVQFESRVALGLLMEGMGKGERLDVGSLVVCFSSTVSATSSGDKGSSSCRLSSLTSTINRTCCRSTFTPLSLSLRKLTCNATTPPENGDLFGNFSL